MDVWGVALPLTAPQLPSSHFTLDLGFYFLEEGALSWSLVLTVTYSYRTFPEVVTVDLRKTH